MGVSATIAVVAGVSTFIQSNNAAHAKTDAHTQQTVNEMHATQQVNAAQDQQQQNLNTQAAATGAAQARVRAISNPSGQSIMTSPLGSGPAPAAQSSLAAPPPSPGQLTPAQGKGTVGG